MPPSAADPPEPDDTAARIAAVVRAAAAGAWSAGRWSVVAAVDGIDQALGPLVARRVLTAIERAETGAGVAELERAIRAARERSRAGAAAGFALPRLVRRLAPVRAATRRSPVGMALWAGPGLVQAVTVGLAEIDALAGHLSARARRAGRVPDPDAIHAVTVAALAGIDPRLARRDRADHAPLLRAWLAAAAGSVVPFGLAGRRVAVEEIVDIVGRLDDDELGRGPGRLAPG